MHTRFQVKAKTHITINEAGHIVDGSADSVAVRDTYLIIFDLLLSVKWVKPLPENHASNQASRMAVNYKPALAVGPRCCPFPPTCAVAAG